VVANTDAWYSNTMTGHPEYQNVCRRCCLTNEEKIEYWSEFAYPPFIEPSQPCESPQAVEVPTDSSSDLQQQLPSQVDIPQHDEAGIQITVHPRVEEWAQSRLLFQR